ncbi:hypothetical protein TD95_003190 [Thielaviopsis punctulata]|uniref:FAD-binding FR-type domain-containing protein n=1 Tax=Thielaviopsis punctulata TaxID=72032 RepID=A0A0F4ZE78_9PEZI|nr:hypothetical protein TD95_003190 [Thielaviopsis punctulata]
MVTFWIVVVVTGLLYRLLSRAALTPEKSPATRVLTLLRHLLVVPATFGYKKAQPFSWFTVPPRVQSAALVAFVGINVWYTVAGYYFTDRNIYFPTLEKQVWRYISDRTGILSYANFPLIWLFGLRNNLLLWLTGWDFGAYNNFHRWVARVSTVHAIIHSVGYTVLVFIDGGWPYFWFFFWQFFWWTGEIATVAMCALLLLSLFFMRRNYYEVFLALHIVLSVAVLYCMWAHLTIFDGRFGFVIWTCSLLWLSDRLLRAARILAFNPIFIQPVRAAVSFSPTANIISLRIPCGRALYAPPPGSFYYIYVLNGPRFWESHPFTAARVPVSPHASSSDAVPLLGAAAAQDLDFLIRPYDGFTARLAQLAGRHVRVLVEGPYGAPPPLQRFAQTLFVVGGSGIVVPTSFAAQLVAARRRVRVIWAVREVQLARAVLKELEALEDVEVHVYVTGEEDGLEDVKAHGVSVVKGRPDVGWEVQEAAREGSTAVVACGPGVMADEARRAVVDVLRRGYSGTEYFEEAFNW